MTSWTTLVHFRAVLLLPALVLGTSGCYRSHERDSADASVDTPLTDTVVRVDGGDSAVGDAGPIAPTDAAVAPDVRPPVLFCEGSVGVTAMRPLTSWPDSVTHRLVNLPGGDFGLVGVESNGSPVNVIYQRFGAPIETRTLRVIAASDSWTWAEPVFHDGRLSIAYGSAGSGRSVLRPLSMDGVGGRAVPIPMFHPMLLQSGPRGMFWLAAIDGRLEMTHLGAAPIYTPLYTPVDIPVDPFGGRTAALSLPNGSHLVAYTTAVPLGVQSFVRTIGPGGALGPAVQVHDGAEHVHLAESEVDGRFLLLSQRDNTVDIQCPADDFERLDAGFLGYEGFSAPLLTGSVRGHFMVVHQEGRALFVTDFGSGCRDPMPTRVPIPGAVASVQRIEAVVSTPDAMVVALRTNAGVLWLVRFGCL